MSVSLQVIVITNLQQNKKHGDMQDPLLASTSVQAYGSCVSMVQFLMLPEPNVRLWTTCMCTIVLFLAFELVVFLIYYP